MNIEHYRITDSIRSEVRSGLSVNEAIDRAFRAGLQFSYANRALPGLTAQQRDLLTYITAYSTDHDGVAPSFEEMKDAMGLRSKSGIHRLVLALEERGAIVRLPNRRRAIGLVKTAA